MAFTNCVFGCFTNYIIGSTLDMLPIGPYVNMLQTVWNFVVLWEIKIAIKQGLKEC